MNPLGEQQRRARMAQIVQAAMGIARFLERTADTSNHIAPHERATEPRAKIEVSFLTMFGHITSALSRHANQSHQLSWADKVALDRFRALRGGFVHLVQIAADMHLRDRIVVRVIVKATVM